MLIFSISELDGQGVRLDRYLVSKITTESRSRLKSLIDEGGVLLEGKKTKASTILKAGQKVSVQFPENKDLSYEPEDIPLDIIFEDNDVIVLNKPIGMVIHPAAGNKSGTLVNALLHYYPDIKSVGETDRPGIVHRLDKDTSGCMVVAKTEESRRALVKQFVNRTISKKYLCVVAGEPKNNSGVIDNFIGRNPNDRKKMAVLTDGGKRAVTEYRVVEGNENWSAIECDLKTGRTHQIRVHMKSLMCPILGDPIYGNKTTNAYDTRRMMLHSWHLSFQSLLGETMKFQAFPEDVFSKFFTLDYLHSGFR